MAVLQDFKCPCCDGAITFDSGSQKMKCPYCDSEFEIDTIRSYQQELNEASQDEMNWEGTPGQSWQEDETVGLRSYVCNSCGGEIVGDASLAATSCPFCDNPVVLKGQFAGDLKPDLVIPFKLDKIAAKAALRNHFKGKPLLPKLFKDEFHLDEVKGIYVPFWLFDASVTANMRYRATRVRTWSDSRYIYTETQHYHIARGGTLSFQGVPVDGSEKMDDDMMESIEPFDLSAAVNFQTAYLAGYLADKYDVDAEQSITRANERIKKSTEDAFCSTVRGYSTVIPSSGNVRLQNGKAKYALYPVWVLNTSWRGQNYRFVMNGQTGKLAGDLPMDKGAYKRWLFGVAGVTAAVAMAISYLAWLL